MVTATRVYYRENNISMKPSFVYSYLEWEVALASLLEAQMILTSPFRYELSWISGVSGKVNHVVFYYIDNPDDLLLIKLTFQENEI